MKLEAKHILQYLPYDIKFTIGYNTVFTLTANHIFNNRNGRFEGLDSDAKILLRPLSDLIKEIEINGEKFVPIEVIEKEVSTYYVSYNFDGNLLFKRKNEGYTWLGDMRLINEKLLQWHFDIHNLIPAGLAIDINTLNK